MSQNSIRAHVTRRNFLRGVGLLSATAALAACAQQDGSQDDASSTSAAPLLAIIHTNDTHGHDVEVKADADTDGNFSMAAVAALKSDWEKKGYDVVIVDAGDATQGVPLVDNTLGTSAIAFMNACGYDLMTMGNHDFDRGTAGIKTFESLAQFPLLSANTIKKKNGKRRFDAHKVVELVDGTKVGFFGLTTPETLTTTNPKHIAGFDFLQDKDLFACAQEQVDELRGQGCELVVCVGHLGNAETMGNNTSKSVLQNVEGIDLFIDGHDHQEVEEEVNGTLLVETGCYFHNIGVVVIDDGAPTNEPVAYGTYEGIDPTVQAIIDDENARMEKELAVVLGETAYLLDGNRAPGVRTQETNLGDFCTDAIKWTANHEHKDGADACVLNGGSLRISIETGDISLGTIKTLMPFSNQVVVVKVTGAQLLEALEAACQGAGTDTPLGAFPQVSGITFTLDSTVPYDAGPNYPDSTYASPASPGSRVTIKDVNGRGFSEGDVYSIATIDFLCDGGDTYYVFKEAAEAEKPVNVSFDYEAIVSYLVEGCKHKVPDEYADAQDRITVIG